MVRSGPHLALPLKQTCRFSGDAAGARSRLSGSRHHLQPKEMLRLSPKRIRYIYLLIKKKNYHPHLWANLLSDITDFGIEIRYFVRMSGISACTVLNVGLHSQLELFKLQRQ